MARNRPVITLQCGNYANYIGAHFWNLQEAGFVYGGADTDSRELLEVDHDVLYREGEAPGGGPTFTPRLVALDLKGSLGLLPQCGDLHGRPEVPSSTSVAWDAGCQVFKEEPHRKNDFLRQLDREAMDDEASEKDIDDEAHGTDGEGAGGLESLDGQVDYWSDYLAARFHPRTVLVADSFQHGNTAHPFDVWGLGRDAAWTGSAGVGEELEDRVRGLAEECDMLGGLQLVADWQDGWGGLASRTVDLLADEYPGKPLLAFPCAPAAHAGYSLPAGWARLAGAALTLSSLTSLASLTSPLSLATDWFPLAGRAASLPHLSYSPALPYHSAAVLALALDTATLPLRRRSGSPGAALTPGELATGLATHGRKLAALATDLPVSLEPASATDYFEGDLVGRTTPLLPGTPGVAAAPAPSPQPYSGMLTLRGLLPGPLHARRSAAFQGCPSAAAYLAACVNRTRRDCRPVGTFLFTRPLSTGRPFPHIFSASVSTSGSLGGPAPRPPDQAVLIAPQLTYWAAGPTAGAAAASLGRQAARLQWGKVHRLGESGVEVEEWTEAVEGVRALAECYTSGDYDMI